MSRCVLMLSYLFPPRGGAGVQRAAKFAKYLPEFGWRPVVVSHGGNARDRVTGVKDTTLLRDLPGEVEVRYTPEVQRGRMGRMRDRMAATDPVGWWVRRACKEAREAMEGQDVRAILVTMSPFTAAEAGIRLKARTGLPLILDLRDPWGLDETRIYPTRAHARRDWGAMARAMWHADLVIMNTPEAMEAARREFRVRPGTRIIALTNGFDGEDFEAASEEGADLPARDVLRIVHTGMFHADQARVWDQMCDGHGVARWLKYARRPINLWTRTARYLLRAMERLVAKSWIPRPKLELVLAGEITEADRAEIEASRVRDCVKVLGYQSHAASVGQLRGADVLFLPLHTPLDGGPALVVPGKTYEYLGSGRPILAMGPAGDMRRFVEGTGSGWGVDGDNVEGAMRILQRVYLDKVEGRASTRPDAAAVAAFERRRLTERLAEELEETVSRCAPARGRAAEAIGYPSISAQHL